MDLTRPLDDQAPAYPGDPAIRIEKECTLDSAGFNLHRLAMGSHAGTHLDAPYHVHSEGLTVDQLDLKLFIGTGIVIPVTGKTPGGPITIDDLAPLAGRFAPGVIVLFNTGWCRHAGEAAYFNHPYLEIEACRYLLENGVRSFGIDAPGLDRPGSKELLIHQSVAARGGVLIENLANLNHITVPDPLVLVLPLKITGSDGSPVRAVALEPAAG